MLFILLVCCLIVGNLLIARVFRTTPVRLLLNLPLLLPPAAPLWWAVGCGNGLADPGVCALRDYATTRCSPFRSRNCCT